MKELNRGARLTTKKDKLRKAIQELECNFHLSRKPTDRDKTPDLLDFFIARKVTGNFTKIEENFDLNSDRSSITMTLKE